MKLHFITIVLDGMPFISFHYPIFRQLKLDWHWWVIEGVAKPVGCTKWVADIPPRISSDGTHGYLKDLARFDPRVTHIARESWPGKVSMFNAALEKITDLEYLLWQVDNDEIWSVSQIEVAALFLRKSSSTNCMWFRCRYFVGPDIVITSHEGYGNNSSYEWKRLWKVPRGTLFERHEPPVLKGFTERPWKQKETEKFGLVFDHYAWATEEQVAFKERFYAGSGNHNAHLLKNAVQGWRRLQANSKWPVELHSFMPWIEPGVTATKLLT